MRRGRGRRVRVERRVIPVAADEERRHEVFERELWRIAVEFLDYGEQHMWAALAGARVAPSGWRRARAMLHFDRTGELKRRFLLTAVERNRNSQLRLRALQEIAAAKDAEAFDLSIDIIGMWARDERREGTKIMLQALAEKRIGRRDQANAWIWRLAEYTREVHEEYAVQRWPETKRLLGLLVNSSGGAHARNARRLVHAARKHDRRLSAALLAAAVAHTPEAEEVLRGARTRMARKPSALSRELLRNFPKGKGRRSRRRRKKAEPEVAAAGATVETNAVLEAAAAVEAAASGDDAAPEVDGAVEETTGEQPRSRSRRRRSARAAAASDNGDAPADGEAVVPEPEPEPEPAPKPRRRRSSNRAATEEAPVANGGDGPAEPDPEAEPAPKSRRRRAAKPPAAEDAPAANGDAADEPKPRRRRTTRATAVAEASPAEEAAPADGAPAVDASANGETTDADPAPKPARRRRTPKPPTGGESPPGAEAA